MSVEKYPDVPLKMYRVSFTMKKRRGSDATMTAIFPAVSEEAARDAVHHFCWGINEATNRLYVTDHDRQVISVFEVEKVRMFTENADVPD